MSLSRCSLLLSFLDGLLSSIYNIYLVYIYNIYTHTHMYIHTHIYIFTDIHIYGLSEKVTEHDWGTLGF